MGSDVYSDKIVEKFILKFAVTFVDKLIVKSHKIACKIKKSVSLIPNGVDLKIFNLIEKCKARENCGLEKDKVYFLFAANPEREEKNFALAEILVNKIKEKISNAELIVVHKKTQKELNEFYNAADFLLLTSNHEGSPNVVKEALATNLPVISTDVGDVSERFEGVTNTYILSGNLENDVSKILSMVKNYSRNNGREMLTDLEISKVAKRIIKVYEEVLKK
ncbi:glycosyltransferase family 4 protein [bacterium]|nr:glycosyltransferase family 4 protein [bacterium]